MQYILSNIWYTLITLVVSSCISYFIFTRIFPLSKIQWKYVDFVWLALASLGLIGVVDSNRRQIISGEHEISKQRVVMAISDLQYQLNVQWVCFKYVRTSNSPDNFDQLQEMSDKTCEWRNKFLSKINEKLKAEFQVEEPPKFTVDDRELQEYVDRIYSLVRDYNSIINEKKRIQEELKPNLWVNDIEFLSPLILILGLSLRFSKAAGEIRLDKQNSA